MLTPDDQLIDIGGGTGDVALKVHQQVGMTKPIVCVDPSLEMLNITHTKKDIILIHATAEDFLATKPAYPLKVVLMNACVHHFEDRDFVFSRLAEYMPVDGVCIIQEGSNDPTYPWFKAAREEVNRVTFESMSLYELIESKGLKWENVKSTESMEVDKLFFYEKIRNRYSSILLKFTDEELKEGIKELEEKYKDTEVIKFNCLLNGIVVTKM